MRVSSHIMEIFWYGNILDVSRQISGQSVHLFVSDVPNKYANVNVMTSYFPINIFVLCSFGYDMYITKFCFYSNERMDG